MMEKSKTYDNFPFILTVIANFSTLLIYVAGTFIMYRLSRVAAILFLIYIIGLEIRLLGTHCVNCYYYGKICGFGKGRISSMLFKKGDPSKFCEGSFTWKDMIPDLLVTLVPLVVGVILLIISFSIFILISLIVIVGLSSMGNAYVRGQITCKYCRQRELGCPAEKLFSK